MIAKLVFICCLGVVASVVPPPPEGPGIDGLRRPSPFLYGNPWVYGAGVQAQTWAQQNNPWIPPWVAAAPWMPQWVACDSPVQGPTCNDCTTRLICTKVGGLLKACTDPALPYCDLGQCVATPSAECTTTQSTEVAEPATNEQVDVEVPAAV